MTSPLVASLAKTVGGAFKSLFLDATLTRVTRLAGSNEWTPGAESEAVYSVKAIHEAWGASWLAQGLVAMDDVKVLILADLCPIEPLPGDVVTIRGEAFTIVPSGSGKPAVATDPARAVWECRAKK